MFSASIYKSRREKLHSIVKSGLAIFPGNVEIPYNYKANTYHFRQDSNFLYFFGIDAPGFTGIMDFDSGSDYMFGNDFALDDIIWMGAQTSVEDLALKSGIENKGTIQDLSALIRKEKNKSHKIHYLPAYSGEIKIFLANLFEENLDFVSESASPELCKAVISMRSIKDDLEIDQLNNAVNIAYEMHVTAMRMCKTGISEQEIFGALQGIAFGKGYGSSFPYIISVNGQILHNHSHNNLLKKNQLLVNDSGAETKMHYTSDITRTIPVDGKFNTRQKEIYEIVLRANTEAIKEAKPGLRNLDLHRSACKIIASGLKEIGLMKGDIDEAVNNGAHALFFPHGLGHMLGLDAHDMESLGEEFIGYNNEIKRSDQFGLAYLRFALPLKPGHVITVEPGCYFIPELISNWMANKLHENFLNYNKIISYLDFGGIRIEDDILITKKGSRLLGLPIPKTINDVENTCSH